MLEFGLINQELKKGVVYTYSNNTRIDKVTILDNQRAKIVSIDAEKESTEIVNYSFYKTIHLAKPTTIIKFNDLLRFNNSQEDSFGVPVENEGWTMYIP